MLFFPLILSIWNTTRCNGSTVSTTIHSSFILTPCHSFTRKPITLLHHLVAPPFSLVISPSPMTHSLLDLSKNSNLIHRLEMWMPLWTRNVYELISVLLWPWDMYELISTPLWSRDMFLIPITLIMGTYNILFVEIDSLFVWYDVLSCCFGCCFSISQYRGGCRSYWNLVIIEFC